MRRAVLLAPALLLLAACGGETETAAAPSSSSAAPTTNSAEDSCRSAGDIVLGAEIPDPSTLPADAYALQVRAAAEDAAGQLDDLDADGIIGSGVSAVQDAMTSISSFPVDEPYSWPGYRSDLTAAVTALQSACASEAGVPDILNQ